jgi:hypothetical protein
MRDVIQDDATQEQSKKNGKLASAYHVENWMTASHQIKNGPSGA